MVVDPLTGLDLSAYEQTVYQIPLDSDPVLAPDWEPQGRYGQVLHPDNIPTVFSTLQAFNNAAPRRAQTLSTDGNKNLNVRVVNGSSTSPLSANGVLTNAGQWESYSYHLVDTENITWSKLLGGMLSVSWTANAGALQSNGAVYLYLTGSDTAVKVPIASLMLPDAVLAGNVPVFGLSIPLCCGGPLDFSNVFAGQLDQINVFIRTFSNPILWSYTLFTDGQ